MGWNSKNSKLISQRGYHFQQSPYVEFDMKGQDLKMEKDEFISKLQKECDKLIQESMSVDDKFVEYDQIKSVIGEVPEYVKKGESLRVVTYDGIACPCSGTHVKKLGEIEKISIRKYQKKGNTMKINYSC